MVGGWGGHYDIKIDQTTGSRDNLEVDSVGTLSRLLRLSL